MISLERAEQLPSIAWDIALGTIVAFTAIPRSRSMPAILITQVSTLKSGMIQEIDSVKLTKVIQETGGPLHS
jgi:hypothetical protein